MKTRIIVDSTTDLTPEVKSRVSLVPLTVHFGDEEYIDGVTIDHRSFYEMLVETDVHPTTSQATPAAFMAQYEKVREAGDSAVVITLSAKLSGTYQSAVIAAGDYENIYVVDSASVTIGAAVLTELALRYLDEGLEAREIAQRLEEEKKRILIVALLDTLEYLKRGGSTQRTFIPTPEPSAGARNDSQRSLSPSSCAFFSMALPTARPISIPREMPRPVLFPRAVPMAVPKHMPRHMPSVP